jgi:LPS sulfotransferase NodH
VDEAGVQTQATLALALAPTDGVQRPVPLPRVASGAGDVCCLIVSVMHRVDVVAVAGSTDAGVVGSRAVSAVDVDGTVLLAQRFQIHPAKVLKTFVITFGNLGTVMTVELLNCEVLAQALSCCHAVTPLSWRRPDAVCCRQHHP